MRVARLLAFVALLGMLVAGCGSGTNITNGSGLQGSYSGAYRIVEGSAIEEGSLTVVIGPDGALSGVMLDNATAGSRTLTGTVRDDRRFHGTLFHPSDTYSLEGNLTMVDPKRVVGVLARTSSTGVPAGTFSIDCTAN